MRSFHKPHPIYDGQLFPLRWLPKETYPMTKPLILVVDDESYIAELLAELLTDELVCEVCIALNGREALTIIQTQRPALVITDLMMPYMDGYALVQNLRAAQLDDIPVILMSAARPRPEWATTEKVNFVPKPFEPTDLLRLIVQLLTL